MDGPLGFDPDAAVRRGEELARRTYARFDPAGADGLGRVRARTYGGTGSFFNRITKSVTIGLGNAHKAGGGEAGRLLTIEAMLHELGHKWFDARAGVGGLLYAGSPGRLSEGLSQVVAGASLVLEGDEAERAFGWKVLDPRGQTAPMPKLFGGRHDVPLSVTMDDVAKVGFTLADQGYVHVHSGVVQAAHLEIAKELGMERMTRLTLDTARRELHPLMGMRGWARATVRTADLAGPAEGAAVRRAWQAVKLLTPA